MPTITVHEAEPFYSAIAHVLDLRPPLTDRLAEMLCRHTVDPYMMVVKNYGDSTRIHVEPAQAEGYDLEAVARRIGREAYGSDAVLLEGLGLQC